LDELLRSTREQFDRAFEHRLREADAAGLRERTGVHTAAATLPPSGTVAAAKAEASDIDGLLNQRFGVGWSAELVETQVTGKSLSALYRLTVDDRSALEFGDAPIVTNEEEALEAARQMALTKCADALAHGASPSGVASSRPLPEQLTAKPRGMPSTTGAPNLVDLDIIEASWRQIRKEAGVVLGQLAASGSVRQKHAESLSLTDAQGRTLIGKPVGLVALLRQRSHDLHPGDVFLHADPYAGGGAAGSWTVAAPVFAQVPAGDGGDSLVGFSAVAAPVIDAGGPAPGGSPNDAVSVFGEGLRVPLVRIFEQGDADTAALQVLLGNTRDPAALQADLRAMAMAAQVGDYGIAVLCNRYGAEAYKQTCNAALDRTNRAMRRLIARVLPEEPKSFEDVVDDDGLGNGPFRLKLAIWREAEKAFLDWTGTSPQAEGPINLTLDDGGYVALVGSRMIQLFDPEVAVNDGFLDLFSITVPSGSVLRPRFPAPVGNQAHTLARVHDVLNGALGQCAETARTAAGYGSSPQVSFTGHDKRGRPFQMTDRVFGGGPGSHRADGRDGGSLSSGATTRPAEQVESETPVSVERVSALADSGGAGLHRGGNGVEKVYVFWASGMVSWRDDRGTSQPWGCDGGRAGASSSKVILRADGARQAMPSKMDRLKVQPGDRLIFRTAGGGGWGNPLDRASEEVQKDASTGMVSATGARDQYGVIITDTGEVDERGTRELRETLARSRANRKAFDFGD
jgi:N-methylhydantoinase B